MSTHRVRTVIVFEYLHTQGTRRDETCEWLPATRVVVEELSFDCATGSPSTHIHTQKEHTTRLFSVAHTLFPRFFSHCECNSTVHTYIRRGRGKANTTTRVVVIQRTSLTHSLTHSVLSLSLFYYTLAFSDLTSTSTKSHYSSHVYIYVCMWFQWPL